jgi:uncharacterized protein
MRNLFVLACGVLFAMGLGVSGLTRPEVILGFLDFAGAWDPTMLAVMAAGTLVYGIAWRLRPSMPLLGGRFPKPSTEMPDARTLSGAALFGAGWGLAGICPGPAVASLGAPTLERLAFFASMLAGMLIYRMTEASRVKSNQPAAQCG